MMELPLYMNDFFGHQTGLVFGAVIGFFFGFVLERAGFGRSTILAAQFYLTDLRVLKVMFTSIVTALLGMTILSGLGVLEISAINIPATYLWPQLVGGLLLGAGFIVSGFCPGTGVVGMASGKLDGLAAIGGVVLGSVLFGFAYPWVEGFYMSGDLGVLRLTDLLGLPQAVLALAVTAMAIGAFVGGDKLERIFSRGDGPANPLATRRRVLTGLAVVSVVGLATMLISKPEPVQSGRLFDTIKPLELAQISVETPTAYYLVDLRTGDGDLDRIPGAIPVPADDPGAGFVADLPLSRTLIVYNQDGTGAIPASVYAFEGHVRVLEGGYARFEAEILTAPELPGDATAGQIELYRLKSALHAHFTGAALTSAPPPPAPKKQIKRAKKKEGGC
jgi:hypothetical protein